MDGVALLAEARAAGLVLTEHDGQLVMRGPKTAAPTALRLTDHRGVVLDALRVEQERWTPPAHYAQLDDVIAADVATRHPRSEIIVRAERLAARAASPEATSLDRALADDWRRVLAFAGVPPRVTS